MDKRIFQPRRLSLDHYTLVCFHVTHGSILIFESAFEAALAAAKQANAGVKAGISVAKHPSQEKHAQSKIVAVVSGILYGLADFLRRFRRQYFVGIQEKNPVISERKRIHGPLTFLGPAPVVVKLHDLGVKGAGDLRRFVGAAGIDDIDFTSPAQRFQAARQVARLIANGNDHAHGQRDGAGSGLQDSRLVECLHSGVTGTGDILPPSLWAPI